MSVDIKGTLEKYLVDGGKAIEIKPDIGSVFGPAVGTAISEIFSASVSIGGANFSLTGDQDKVTITGQGNAPPLLPQIDASLTFAVQESGASMDLSAQVQSNLPLSDAWSQLKGAPFTSLELTQGNLALDVNFGDSKFELDISGNVGYEQQTVGAGLLKVQYDGSSLGFAAGFAVTGNWTPVSHWSVLNNLAYQRGQGSAAIFLTTIPIAWNDTGFQKAINAPVVPDTTIQPGLTFATLLTFASGDLAKLAKFAPPSNALALAANIPLSNPTNASIQAGLRWAYTNGAWEILDFNLAWQLASKITISVTAQFKPDKNDVLQLSGTGTFVYGGEPSLDLGLTLSGSGSWTHPFGIQNVTIESFSVGFSVNEEGLSLAAGGSIKVGTGSGAVVLTLAAGITDFEEPSFLYAEVQAADKGTMVTLPELVQDFIPSLNLNSFPLLNQIAFSDLKLLVVAAPTEYNGKSYGIGVGVTGDISFFGYILDFAFTLTSSPFAVQAKGTLSDKNGGPIKISAGGVQILTISDASGTTKGPSACIDTTGGSYCGQGNYFTATAGLSLLGLVKASLLIQASKSGFCFDAALEASTIFSDTLHCEFYPDKGDFAAYTETKFNPGQNLTIPAYGPFPGFSIPLPNFDLILAVGTVLPTAPIGPDKYMPTAPPYFYFYFDFTWGIVDFKVSFGLDWGSVSGIFTDFSGWLVKWVENNALQLLGDLAKDATEVAKLLFQIGWIFFEILEKLIETFINMAVEVLTDIVSALFGTDCSISTADQQMSPASTSVAALYHEVPAALVDLNATERGQSLLYHYYLNKPELDEMMRPGTATSERLHQVLAKHVAGPDLTQGRVMPAAIDLLREASEHGSADLKASAEEVLPLLQEHQGKTYTEFLTALAA